MQDQEETIKDYIDRMPSLSTTVTKVLQVCNTPNAAPNDLNRVISLDPVLTGQVLKMINSAYYSLPNQISSLTRAIIMLGLNTVKNLALSTAIIGTLGKQESFKSLPMDAFWAHSICVGVTAKLLAAMINVPTAEREEYFVAGMLHDLGKIPLNNCFAETYVQALQLADLEQSALYRSEKLIVGIDHGAAGSLIAKKWQLNDTIVETLSFHHSPERASEKNRKIVAAVALANLYANIYEIGSAGDLYSESQHLLSVLELMGMKWDDLRGLGVTVMSEIEKAQVFLQGVEKG
nr:HDOD domain-containing protein [Desulfobulbaceae bacterium]